MNNKGGTELSVGELKLIQMKIEKQILEKPLEPTFGDLAKALLYLALHEITKKEGCVDGWHP